MCACNPADYVQWKGNFITAVGMTGVDPVQSPRLDNCSLIAALSACGWTGKGAWYKSVAANAAVAGSYSLQFYDYKGAVPLVKPSSKLPQDLQGNLLYAKSAKGTECWPGIIEKGYYMARDRLRNIDSDTPDMEYYNDTTKNPTLDPPTVLYQLFRAEPVKRSTVLNGTDYKEGMIWSNLKSICSGKAPLLKILYPAVAYSYERSDTFSPKHTYSILGLAGTLDTDLKTWTSKYIVLRDPLNVSWEPPLKSPDVLTSGKWLSGIDFAARDGIFAISSDLFPTYFQGYAYVVC
jgi:hypothetical protein